MLKTLISQVEQLEDSSIKEIIEQEEAELKEIKLKLKNLDNVKITRMKVLKQKSEPKPNVRENIEKKELIKKCRDCQTEKTLDQFVINYTYNSKKNEEKKSIKMKNKCLDCYKDLSKKYYASNKERVLNMLANKYEKLIKQKYTVKLNFNTIEEMELEFNKAKEQFLKGEIKEVKRKNKKKTGDGGNQGGSSNSPASETV